MSVRYLQDQPLRASREGRAIHKFIDDDAGVTAGFVVQTAAGIYYDIPAGHQVIVNTLYLGCSTVDDEITAYLVSCAATAGGGAATQKMHHWKVANGAKKEGVIYRTFHLDVPVCIKYSEAARSVSMAVKGTDTDIVGTYGWCGWVEEEGTLS